MSPMPFTENPDWVLNTPVITTNEAGAVVDEVRPRRMQPLADVGLQFNAPVPRIVDRDMNALAEQKAQEMTSRERALYPALFDARAKLERALMVRSVYARQISDLQFAVSQAWSESNSASGMVPGLAEQRRANARVLQAELNELREEYSASEEEVTAARAVVQEEFALHMARVEASKVQP